MKVRVTKAPKRQTGGGLPVTKGLPAGQEHLANIEAEEGEVYQDKSGKIIKIDPKAGSHEEGGVMIPDADRVLEDTSLDRRDKASKRLKMSAKEVATIFGPKPKRPLTHAKAFEFVTAEYGKQVATFNKAQARINDNPDFDKYAANSTKLNFQNREFVPDSQDVFDTLFAHQEAIKTVHGIENDGTNKYGGYKTKKVRVTGLPQAQAGFDPSVVPEDNPDFGLYKGPKNKSNMYTPTGKTSEAKLSDKQIADAYTAAGVNVKGLKGAELQKSIYSYLIDNQPDVLKSILSEYGANKKAISGKVDKKLKAFTDPMNASQDDLKKALPYLVDSLPGARIPLPSVEKNTQTDQPQPGPAQPANAPARPQLRPKDPNVNINPNFKQQPENKFFEPTNWYDLAPGLMELTDSLTRDPELYNPVQLHQLKYKLLNPTAALNANQSDFNAVAQQLGNQNIGAGASAANLSNLYAQKTKANQQVIGAYENENTGITNREIDYNTGVRDRQSLADAKSRETFYDNVLKSRDNQRLQKLQAVQDISRVQQLKARQNTSGNLVLKMTPAFNQSGDYNGYQYMLHLPSDVGGPQPDQTPSKKKYAPTSKTSTTTTWKTADGRTIRRVNSDTE